MSVNDDFDEFDERDERYELERDEDDQGGDDLVDEPDIIEPTVVRRNRAERRRRPQPQDRMRKKSVRAREADPEDVIVLRLYDRTYRVRRGELAESWDYMLGMANDNPMQMMKGILGARGLLQLSRDAKAHGVLPMEAAEEVFEAFSDELGLTSGN